MAKKELTADAKNKKLGKENVQKAGFSYCGYLLPYLWQRQLSCRNWKRKELPLGHLRAD